MSVTSAFTIETGACGFLRCTWPAVSLKQAKNGARSLSGQASESADYPNAFWVFAGSRAVCKFYRGEEYAPDDTI